MTQRTDTKRQSIFHHPDQGVTLSFIEPNQIRFTLLAAKKWRSPYHWHVLHDGCHRITCLQGSLHLTTATPYGGSATDSVGAGTSIVIPPRDHHAWSAGKQESDQELIVLLESEDEILYRNTSSATIDADRFPSLSSTPLWVKLLYSLLAFSPTAQRSMIARLLWIQLQIIYFAHDFCAYHGSVHAPFFWFITHPFSLERPPNWIFNIEWWSVGVISNITQRACYWFGSLFLGMKAEYPEYTPVDIAARSSDVKE